MSPLVKRGTARRLGMWVRPVPVPLAQIDSGSETYSLSAVGSRAVACFVDSRGRIVAGPQVAVGAGAIRQDRRVAGPERVQIVRTGGQVVGESWQRGSRGSAMGTNDVRDAIAATSQDMAGLVMSRDQVVEKWCRDHGKDKDSLSIADIMAIRSLPEWINAG